MIVSSDQIVLAVSAELDKISTESGNPYNEILILLRGGLSFPQRLRGNDVVLDLHAAGFKVGKRHVVQLFDTVMATQRARVAPISQPCPS